MVLPFGLRSAPFIFTAIVYLVHNYGVDNATTWMIVLSLVRRHPRSATPIYLPVFAIAKGLAFLFILTS